MRRLSEIANKEPGRIRKERRAVPCARSLALSFSASVRRFCLRADHPPWKRVSAEKPSPFVFGFTQVTMATIPVLTGPILQPRKNGARKNALAMEQTGSPLGPIITESVRALVITTNRIILHRAFPRALKSTGTTRSLWGIIRHLSGACLISPLSKHLQRESLASVMGCRE